MNEALARWNGAEAAAAEAEVLPCNGSVVWAGVLVARRPFASVEALLTASDEVWAGLEAEAWRQAFDSHPRIGEVKAKAATVESLRWSSDEQGGVLREETVRAALVEGNRRYEERFGRVFLVCATGKSAEGMLAILEARLRNAPQAEWREAGEQQRRITQLRLRRWLGLAAVRCEDV